jgi:hypothetical protein
MAVETISDLKPILQEVIHFLLHVPLCSIGDATPAQEFERLQRLVKAVEAIPHYATEQVRGEPDAPADVTITPEASGVEFTHGTGDSQPVPPVP